MIMLPFNKKKIKNPAVKGGGNKILIKINVVGSAGPIRFMVNEKTVVAAVIETALKSYAREDRLPVLGTKFSDFFLYTPIAGTEGIHFSGFSQFRSISHLHVCFN